MKLQLKELHFQSNPDGLPNCCATDMLSILFNEPIRKISRIVLQRRKKHYYKDILAKRAYKNISMNYVHYMDWREIVGILRKHQPNLRSQLPTKCNVMQFSEKRKNKTDKTYVLFIKDHVLIVKNGLIYDNMEFATQPHNYWQRKSKVQDYCVLQNN